jgi:hypothetical protein
VGEYLLSFIFVLIIGVNSQGSVECANHESMLSIWLHDNKTNYWTGCWDKTLRSLQRIPDTIVEIVMLHTQLCTVRNAG